MIACKDCVHAMPEKQFERGAFLTFLFGEDKNKWRYAQCAMTLRIKMETEYAFGITLTKTTAKFCSTERRYGECGPEAQNFLGRSE